MIRPPRRPFLVALLPVALLGVAVVGPTPEPVQHLAAGWGLGLGGAWAAWLAHRRTLASGDDSWRRVTRTLALWTVGQALFAATDGRPGSALTLSSVVFVLVAVSAADVVFRSARSERVSALVAGLDAICACLVLVALLWDAVLAPAVAATSFLDAVPFPLIEVAVVALGFSILGQSGSGDRTLVAIVAATAGMLVGDARYLYEVGHGGYRLGSPADALWLVGVAAVVVVAVSTAPHRRTASRWWHQTWLAVPFGMLSVEAIREQLNGGLTPSVVFCGSLAMLAYIVRQVVLQHDLVALSNSTAEDRDRLAEAEERARLLLEYSGDGIVGADLVGRIGFANRAAEAIFGLGPAGAIGRTVHELVHRARPDGSPYPIEECALAPAVGRGEALSVELDWWSRSDGTFVPVEYDAQPVVRDGQPWGSVISFRDVSARLVAEEQLRHLASHDALTGLPNRAALPAWLDARADGLEPFGLVLLDLDRFKDVNDALGHPAGDELLCRVADRLAASVRPGDLVAHLGGDEFVAVLPGVDGHRLEEVAARLLGSLEEPIDVAGWIHTVSASAGCALGVVGDLDRALQQADIAMYRVKRSAGGGGLATYGPEDEQDRMLDLELTTALRQAIHDGDVAAWYQVKVDGVTGRPAGVEALARWRHPGHGDISPMTFVALAERAGLIGGLTDLILDRAIAQAVRWRADGLEVPVAVNVSPISLRDRRFADDVLLRLDRAGLPARLLEVEITEAALVDRTDAVLDNLSRLRARGVRVSIDDFGTGYSSLSYLKVLPVDTLKIDRSFVAGLDTDETDRKIVAAICVLGRSLGLAVVGEGVETEAIAEKLLEAGCDIHQGFLYHRPAPGVDVTAVLARRWDHAWSTAEAI